MKAKACAIFIVVIFICALLSCQSIAGVMDKGAQKAGQAGVFSQNTVDAISNTSRAISSAAEDINPEQEYYIGRAVAANILATYKIWNGNPSLTSYLNMICSAITINSSRPDVYNGYHVAMLDTNEINAFATSGGHIFLTRGLVNAAKSEEALAAVIAHEVAHIQLKHSIRAIKTSRITQAILVTGASAAGAVTGMNVNELTDVFIESVGEITQTLVNNGYSQLQEYAADNYAVSLLASAGYNPSGLIDMLKELNAVQKENSGGFNKTHPTPALRITNAEKIISGHRVTDTSSYRQSRFQASVRLNR
jgi:predicted Zn-dependent protease